MRMSMIDGTGYERFFGNIPQAHDLLTRFPVYGDVPQARMIARPEWPALIEAQGNDFESPFLPYVHDQDGVGQCNADATVTCAEYCRAIQGLPFIGLSAADLYDRINGGSDRGSLLEDAIAEMMARGVGTVATSGTIWKQGMKRASADERKRFQLLEAYVCPTFDHCMSAVLSGFALNSGIFWYDNYEPDGDGWLPVRRQGNFGGHSVFGYKGRMRAGKFGIAHQNSWGERWGVNGRCVFPEESYKGDVGGWFAVRLMTDEGGVIPTPQA